MANLQFLVRQEIIESNFKEALEILSKNLPKSELNGLSTVQGTWTTLQRQSISGMISLEEERREKAKLTQAILYYAEKLGNKQGSTPGYGGAAPTTQRRPSGGTPTTAEGLIAAIKAGMQPARILELHLDIFNDADLTDKLEADEDFEAWDFAVFKKRVIGPNKISKYRNRTIEIIEAQGLAQKGDKKKSLEDSWKALNGLYTGTIEAPNVLARYFTLREAMEFFSLATAEREYGDFHLNSEKIREGLEEAKFSLLLEKLLEVWEREGEKDFEKALAKGKREDSIIRMRADEYNKHLGVLIRKYVKHDLRALSDRISRS